jgi:hypothetical protein
MRSDETVSRLASPARCHWIHRQEGMHARAGKGWQKSYNEYKLISEKKHMNRKGIGLE